MPLFMMMVMMFFQRVWVLFYEEVQTNIRIGTLNYLSSGVHLTYDLFDVKQLVIFIKL